MSGVCVFFSPHVGLAEASIGLYSPRAGLVEASFALQRDRAVFVWVCPLIFFSVLSPVRADLGTACLDRD